MDRSKWEYKKLGEVASIRTGKLDANAANENGLYPFFTCSKEPLSINSYSYDCECILVAGNGELNVKYYKGKFDAYQRTYIIQLQEGIKDIDMHYLYQFFSKYIEVLRKKSIGGVIKYIKLGDLTEAQFPLYPITDQQRIVAELDCLNEMIALKQEQLKEFDKLAQSIFYDMFGRGMSQKQWEHTTIGSLSEEIKYGTSSPATPNGKYKYLRMNNMTNDGYLDLSDLKYIDVDANDYEKYVVRRGDILFNRTNSRELVGKTALFNFDEEMIIAGYIIRVRLKSIADPYYVVRYMNLPEQKEYLRGLCRGAIGQANINAKELQAIPIPLPPLSLQQQFADKISAIEAQKEMVKQSIAETQHLLDYTMDKYFG